MEGTRFVVTVGAPVEPWRVERALLLDLLGPASVESQDDYDPIRFVLDGLGCETLGEAKRLVDAGRVLVGWPVGSKTTFEKEERRR